MKLTFCLAYICCLIVNIGQLADVVFLLKAQVENVFGMIEEQVLKDEP